MQIALARLHHAGINFQNIIDVGAASGKWTEKSLQYWPEAHYELVEPLEEQIPQLESLAVQYPRLRYHTGVAGAEPGRVPFSVSTDLDGSGVYGNQADNLRMLPQITIDSITQAENTPCLIKLDTHGYEIPILEGAARTLENTEALIIEVYGFYVSPTALLFHKLSAWLEERGFRLFDIADVMRREKDNAFWQADAVYLKASHPIFKDNSYR